MKKKYFLYTRVSNDDYEKSIDNQKDVLEKIADEKKILANIVKPYYEEHKSWSINKERPLFDKMMQELEVDMKEAGRNINNRKYWWILFFKIDRLARNDKDFERLLRLLDAGYEFISATETIENTPTGRLLFRMLSSFAVYESEKLSNRQSIAKIHNLISEKFNSLGWDIVIFGYEVKDWKIQVNKLHAEIISVAYDLFIESHWKLSYEKIFSILDERYNWELTNYLKEKWKTIPKKFMENVIKNINALKYNWYIEINLGVNDELIKNYLDTISDKKYDKYWFSLEGDCKIGGKVKFVHFLDDFMIIPNAIYQQKDSITEGRKFDRKENNNKKCLFENILYVKYNDELHKFVGKPDQKKWIYNNYRLSIWSKNFWISEKKIDDKIISSNNILKVLKNIPLHIVDIKDVLLQNNKIDIAKERKKRTATINLYNWFKDRYYWLLSERDENVELYTKLFKKYSDLVQYASEELHAIEQNSILLIDKYLDIMNIQNIKNQPEWTKRFIYISLFDKIIYEPLDGNRFRVILHPFTFLSELLWLPKEIVI